VRYYTRQGAGAIDNTHLVKVCWEMEQRPPYANVCPGLTAKYDVVQVGSFMKLEHMVPVWTDGTPGQKEMFYINKYASFS
jgi:hypothetical protein